jgi:sec-independent protein translocase protein TatC
MTKSETPLSLEKIEHEQNGNSQKPEPEYLDELPDEVEMSLFDHLEELRQRIFYSLIAVAIAMTICFIGVKPLVAILEVPAQGIKFLQLSPGEYFFVTVKVAGYTGLLLASPFILYQVIKFVLPGLTRKERQLLGPLFFGSSILFLIGLSFAYSVIVPAALNFFIGYGEGVVEQLWSIDKYFEFVLQLMFFTSLAFQIPTLQLGLNFLGIVNAGSMFAVWKYVVLGAVCLGAIITPSTDPLTQSLLSGAIMALYFGGIGLIKLGDLKNSDLSFDSLSTFTGLSQKVLEFLQNLHITENITKLISQLQKFLKDKNISESLQQLIEKIKNIFSRQD